MKRTLALLLAFALCLCACKSEEAKNAEALIDAIGTVTLDSEAALTAAEAAYAALTDEDKASVENYGVLEEARAAYEAAQVGTVEELINAIGTVTLDSEAALTAAEEAYAALGDGLKAQVANAAQLADARTAYEAALAEAAREAMVQSITGTWVHEIFGYGANSLILAETDCTPVFASFYTEDNGYDGYANTFTLEADGTFQVDGVTIGTWTLADDCSQITAAIEADGIDTDTITMTVSEEDGFVKLFGEFLGTKAAAYVLESQFQEAFDAKYAIVELSGDNFRDYIGEPVSMGSASTLDGTTHYWHFFPSEAYDDGLVYLGCDAYVDVEFSYGGDHKLTHTYPVMMGFNVNVSGLKLGESASGELFYVKADYIAKNSLNEEGFRVLELTNGMELRFSSSAVWDSYEVFWTLVGADYNDYLY